MTEPLDGPGPDGLPEDTIVLGGEDPPPRRPAGAPDRRRWPAVVAGILIVAAVAWVNRPRPGDPPPIADDPNDQGARSRPVYPGAEGRLLFTVQEEPRAGELAGERLYALQLDTGAVDAGPLLPPVGTASGFPAGPGVPPQRSFLLGPSNSPSAGTLAFLGDAGQFGLRRFAYTLDVGGVGLPEIAFPVTRAHAVWWEDAGALLTVRQEPGRMVVERTTPGGQSEAESVVPGDRGLGTEVVQAGGRVFLITHAGLDVFDAGGPDSIVEVFVRRPRVLLRGYRVVGVGRNTQFLVIPTNRGGPVHRWVPGGPPRRLEGFVPEVILGWTGDRQHYAARGEFRGQYGVWFVAWPNTPVFLMHPIELESSGLGPDAVAFDRDGGVAFFVSDLELWMVEIGSERARRVPLPDDVARETPSGPMVWVP